MKAIVHSRYGPPDVLELKDIDKPVVNEDGVLVRVHAAAVGKGDWLTVGGLPYVARLRYGLPKPKHPVQDPKLISILLPQPDAEQGHRADDQEFALPVLERLEPELRRRHKAEHRHRLFPWASCSALNSAAPPIAWTAKQARKMPNST